MLHSPKGIGIDCVDVARFVPYAKDVHNHALQTMFFQEELTYCFSYEDPSTHLAGTFAAKEAVFKALGRKDILFSIIEIRRQKDGAHKVWIDGIEQHSILLSISHTQSVAMAISVCL